MTVAIWPNFWRIIPSPMFFEEVLAQGGHAGLPADVFWGFLRDDESKCSLTQWSHWDPFTSRVLQSWGPASACPEVLPAGLLEACHFRRADAAWSNAISASSRHSAGIRPHCSCPSNTHRCNKACLCTVVLRRWQHHHMRQSISQWQHLRNPRSAEEHAANSSLNRRICCDPGRWIGCDVGPSSLRWWELCSPKLSFGFVGNSGMCLRCYVWTENGLSLVCHNVLGVFSLESLPLDFHVLQEGRASSHVATAKNQSYNRLMHGI